MISAIVIPLATRFTSNATVIRIPRMQARPPITCDSKVIRSNPSIAPPDFFSQLPDPRNCQTDKRIMPRFSSRAYKVALEQTPNARHEPLPEAGAQRTLEAVGSMPLILLE